MIDADIFSILGCEDKLNPITDTFFLPSSISFFCTSVDKISQTYEILPFHLHQLAVGTMYLDAAARGKRGCIYEAQALLKHFPLSIGSEAEISSKSAIADINKNILAASANNDSENSSISFSPPKVLEGEIVHE